MVDSETGDRTYGFGKTALAYIRKCSIPAYPRNYELWYTYAAGFNQALNKAINEILSLKRPLTADEVSNIYNDFLAPNRLGDRIDEVGGQVSVEIETLLRSLSESIDATDDYGSSLTTAVDSLEKAGDADEINRVIHQLVSTTKEMAEHNDSLKTQLSESQRQVADLQENLEAIRFESMNDELTTLANRKHFDQSIERSVTAADDEGAPFSLLMTDIDHFKKFNDTWGHQTGDQVLRLVALAVKQNVKGQDIACRYGGEEFAIILPKTDLEQAGAVAENIRMAVQQKELIKRSTGENLGRMTISIGVAEFRDGDNSMSIVERADKCLYAAKRNGRNMVVCENDAVAQDAA